MKRPCATCPHLTTKDGGSLTETQAVRVVNYDDVGKVHPCHDNQSVKCLGHIEQNQRVSSGQAQYNGDEVRFRITLINPHSGAKYETIHPVDTT